jgi:hypothetical protein
VEALTETTENTWQLNTVDDPLSRVIEKALRFPQTITIKGKETAVFIPVDVYQKLAPSKENLADFPRGSLEDGDKGWNESMYRDQRYVPSFPGAQPRKSIAFTLSKAQTRPLSRSAYSKDNESSLWRAFSPDWSGSQ